jgi:hypothetical protein
MEEIQLSCSIRNHKLFFGLLDTLYFIQNLLFGQIFAPGEFNPNRGILVVAGLVKII